MNERRETNHDEIKTDCARKQSPSPDLIGSNEYLLRNILIYVSYDKPLCRFKSVSKLWLSIISHPDFTLAWQAKHVHSPSGFIVSVRHLKFFALDEREQFLPAPNLDLKSLLFEQQYNNNAYSRPSVDILQSCNGLLLVSRFDPTSQSRAYAVVNPTTNQFKLIPATTENPYNWSQAFLAFDPSKSPHYKVIFIRYDMYIYESELEQWRAVPLSEKSYFPEKGVYWNEAIHWSNRKTYFDIRNACFSKMPMRPIEGNNQKKTAYFGESGGHLLLIYSDRERSVLQFDIFEMESDHSKWVVKYNVDLTALSLRYKAVDFPNPKFRFLTFFSNGDKVKGGEESAVLVLELLDAKSETDIIYIARSVSNTNMVISYNLQTGKSKTHCHLVVESSLSNYCIDVWPFIRIPAIVL